MQASGWCCMRSTLQLLLMFSFVAPPGECYYNTLLCCNDYFSLSSVVSRGFSALCVYSKFGHHPHPLGYLCVKCRFFAATIAELAHGEKSYTHSLNHSPRLFDASGSEACTSEKIEHVSSVTCECNWLYTVANTFALKISCTYVSKTVNTQNFLVNLT